MTRKIFRCILLVAVAVLLASLSLVMGLLYSYFSGVREEQLRDALDLAAAAVEQEGVEYLGRLESEEYRITWVDEDGTVLYDTDAAVETMDNHADRREVADAFSAGQGSDTRYSATLTEQTTYYARLLSNGTVLRVSISHATILMLVLEMAWPILLVALAAIILSAVLAKQMAGRVVEPLNRLDLDDPLGNDVYEELSPLLRRINMQHRQITDQLRDLKQKTDEFDQITGNMNEGLVLLDERGKVLSINPAAMEVFGTDRSCLGQDFLTMDRSHDVSLAIRSALTEGHGEVWVERGGREYRFAVSRIQSGGETVGAVLLTFDITERAFAERSRREFTANVSHELKTPLQSIIGSAELLENGMVKTEDIPRFVGHIRNEAARLVTLIEDIIRLSQLDEKAEMPREEVDLLALAREVKEELADTAEAMGVSLSVRGQPAVLDGVRRLLHEIMYNLCENAIKYNREGGSVEIALSQEDAGVSLTVKDTGIGIPPEHQDRVFERFYRVDKSHSKASGGTGLGLSIVKHAAQYHDGAVELTSTVGEGTAITIRFPV